jgi:hypothetical protein
MLTAPFRGLAAAAANQGAWCLLVDLVLEYGAFAVEDL